MMLHVQVFSNVQSCKYIGENDSVVGCGGWLSGDFHDGGDYYNGWMNTVVWCNGMEWNGQWCCSFTVLMTEPIL